MTSNRTSPRWEKLLAEGCPLVRLEAKKEIMGTHHASRKSVPSGYFKR